jgi:hypothetical protein
MFKMKVPANLVPGEVSLPGLWMAVFSPCPDITNRILVSSSSYKKKIPSLGPHSHDFTQT